MGWSLQDTAHSIGGEPFELRPEKLTIQEFPGYRNVHLTKDELSLIVGQGLESWRAALSSVAGVYLIADSATGKLYVGSASGEGGMWQRWAAYAATGHGGNVELRELLRTDVLRNILEAGPYLHDRSKWAKVCGSKRELDAEAARP